MNRRILLATVGALTLGLSTGLAHAQDKPSEKVLRYAFQIAETGFDPAQISDLYSRIAARNMFEALYDFDYLARPVVVIPRSAEALPVIADDFRTFTDEVF